MDKKHQQRKVQIGKKDKASKSDKKIKNINETNKKNKFKVQNLEASVVTKNNKKRASKNDTKILVMLKSRVIL